MNSAPNYVSPMGIEVQVIQKNISEDQCSVSDCSVDNFKKPKHSKKSDKSKLENKIKHLERSNRQLKLQIEALISTVKSQYTTQPTNNALSTHNSYESLMITDDIQTYSVFLCKSSTGQVGQPSQTSAASLSCNLYSRTPSVSTGLV